MEMIISRYLQYLVEVLLKAMWGNTSGQIYTDAELNFTIIYQNGIDQQLTAEIEGATIDTEYSSKSTSYGRCYSFNFDYFPYPEKHPLTLVIKDKKQRRSSLLSFSLSNTTNYINLKINNLMRKLLFISLLFSPPCSSPSKHGNPAHSPA